jgi:(p)ppGpp synthase/HD superfamily hydrolase
MDSGKIILAKTVAEFMHTLQSYGNGNPYDMHLNAVVKVLLEFNPSIHEDYIIAAYLHDLVEDTPATLRLIEKHFGKNVADLVYGVTNERGRYKQDVRVATYIKLGTWYRKAIVLKLADRIANVRQSVSNKENGYYDKYQGEYQLFRNNLYCIGEHIEMWAELDRLMEYSVTVKE